MTSFNGITLSEYVHIKRTENIRSGKIILMHKRETFQDYGKTFAIIIKTVSYIVPFAIITASIILLGV